MTAFAHVSAFASQGEAERFGCLRSTFIDEFARLEIAVEHSLKRLDLGSDARKVCFAQRLVKLSKARPCSHLSKEKAKTLPGLIQDCGPLQRVRAGIVHAVMEIGTRGGEPVAFFRNAADANGGEQIYHVMTVSEFKAHIKALQALTTRVANSLNPSPPPPPKPDAAAGP